MGAPRPEGLLSLGGLCFPPPAALSHPLTSFSGEKKIATHLLCVCLNKIYIVLSFLFSFFSCLLSNIAHQSSLAGTSCPLPSSWLELGLLLGQEAGEGRGCRRAGRQATGLRRGAGPACSGWLFGWSLELGWHHLVPCYSPAISTGRTTSGACPRILGQVSCLSWALLPLSTLPVPPPLPLPSPLEA